MWISRASLLLACGVATCRAATVGNEVEILGLAVSQDSIVAHRTDKYRLHQGFAVRRGQPFTVDVFTADKLAADQTISINLAGGERAAASYFSLRFVGSHSEEEGVKNTVEVSTGSDSDIGKFEDVEVVIKNKDGTTAASYTAEHPIYVIFNPYNKDDQTYVADEIMRKEYLENEHGVIYNGFAHDYFSYKWFYAQFDQLTLDAAFSLVGSMKANQSKVVDVAAHISVNQGWYADDDTGDITGNKKLGLIEGRWSDELRDYPGGTDPEAWVSTRDLLSEWRDKGRGAKYGQCYIFGSIQNSLLRSLGVASRQLSAFDARIDESAAHYADKKQHHVVNNYYDRKGTKVKNEGQIWNFHSWNDLWLNNVLGTEAGWCALDGTPPGTPKGPGPLKLVYDLNEVIYTITDMISTAKSAERHVLVDCESKDMCNMKKVIKFDTKGVRKIVTPMPLDGDKEEVITHQYNDDSKDAYIAVPHDPWHPDAPKDIDAATNDDAALDIDVKIAAAPAVVTGEGIEATATVRLTRRHVTNGGKPAVTIDVNVVAELQTQRGVMVKELARVVKTMTLDADADDKEIVVPLCFPAKNYLERNIRAAPFIEVRAFASAREQAIASLDSTKVHIRAPDMNLGAAAVRGDNGQTHIPVELTVVNPHDFELETVCASVHAPHLVHTHDTAQGSSMSMVCASLGPNESRIVSFRLYAPEDSVVDSHTIVAKVSGDYLPMSVTHVDVHASQAVDQSEVYGTYLTNTGTGAKRLAAAVSASS